MSKPDHVETNITVAEDLSLVDGRSVEIHLVTELSGSEEMYCRSNRGLPGCLRDLKRKITLERFYLSAMRGSGWVSRVLGGGLVANGGFFHFDIPVLNQRTDVEQTATGMLFLLISFQIFSDYNNRKPILESRLAAIRSRFPHW